MNAPFSTTGPLLGEVIVWDTPTKRVDYPALQAALDATGLDRNALAELRPQTAMRRALADMSKYRAIDKLKTDDAGAVSFQLTHKTTRANLVEYTHEARVDLDGTGHVHCPDSYEIETTAQQLFDEALAHRTTSDISRFLMKLFAAHADLFAINPRKGVAYFVPHEHQDFTAQVQNFLSAIGGQLYRLPVPAGTVDGNRSVSQAVDEGLQELARDLETASRGWSETTRTSTMERALEQWRTIAHKAEAYAEYLGDRQQQTLAKLAEAKATLRAEILRVNEQKDAAKEGPTMRPLFAETPAPMAYAAAGCT